MKTAGILVVDAMSAMLAEVTLSARWRTCQDRAMTDELDDYEEGAEHEEALVAELTDEADLADADEILDLDAEPDETPFDETRLQYSGVQQDGDGDIDVEELAEAGALLDDPEREALIGRAMDDPDGSGG